MKLTSLTESAFTLSSYVALIQKILIKVTGADGVYADEDKQTVIIRVIPGIVVNIDDAWLVNGELPFKIYFDVNKPSLNIECDTLKSFKNFPEQSIYILTITVNGSLNSFENCPPCDKRLRIIFRYDKFSSGESIAGVLKDLPRYCKLSAAQSKYEVDLYVHIAFTKSKLHTSFLNLFKIDDSVNVSLIYGPDFIKTGVLFTESEREYLDKQIQLDRSSRDLLQIQEVIMDAIQR